ncbi:hypothetical protein [Rubripirellula reticaptiva]|uniref:Uncharacterized protein n=1 Tax=Rubripirellula reticaptiva TaxID=2528013 RepID=A0A5C6EA85_9BACT|nr:hypothetical protein [Rubripirellula reticaptiva]TWU46623.1 hypothetical protein Poly59_55960 [Rubripirellula reticaptiva]
MPCPTSRPTNPIRNRRRPSSLTVLKCEMRTYSREEFYEFVWSKPATKLVNELGCSDVMIGKVCKLYDIPKPYPGYWAKLGNGKKPSRTKLPDNNDPDLQSLTFYRHEDYEATVNGPPRELQYDEEILDALAKSKSLGPVIVRDTLRSAHLLIARRREQIEKDNRESKIPWSERNYDAREERKPTIDVSASSSQWKRALRIMDALIKRVEAIGGSVEIQRSGYNGHTTSTVVIIAGEKITDIRLREKHNQVRIKNKDAKYAWERNRTELVPSGLLMFDDGPSSYRSPLAMDGKAVKIEGKLDAMILGFIKEAGEIRIRRREQEEIARQEAEAERIRLEREAELQRRRDALERLQAEEQRKVNELLSHADAWRQSGLLRDYLDALCERCVQADQAVPLASPLADYLRWGFAQADRRDPLCETPSSVLDETVDESDLEQCASVAPKKPR